MATLAEMLRQGADRIINLPMEAQRFITNPQAFTQAVTGKNPLPRETGFAAGATGLTPDQISVLDPNTKEAGLGPNQYEANLTDFYNVVQDPDNLNQLARQYNQYQGIVDQNAATNGIERIANEAGYKGITNTGGSISFVPQDLKRKK